MIILPLQFDRVKQRKKDKKYALAFGQHVKKLRDERNWSQGQLASLADMSGQQISAIERGKHAPNLNTIKDIAIALGKYPDELLRFDFNLDLNTDFGPSTKKPEYPATTLTIIKLLDTTFFESPRSVSEVVLECLRLYNSKFRSPAVSAVLKRLVDAKKLKRVKSVRKRGTFEYVKR